MNHQNEKRLVEFVGEIAEAVRSPARSSAEATIKSRWRWFVESNFAVALITVVIGGLFGQWITASIQNGLKEREFQQAWLKVRGDQALLAHKEYLDREQETVTHAYDLIGSCVTAAHDLIDLTDKDFALETIVEEKRKDVLQQKTNMLVNYNSVEQKWDSEADKTGLLMGYYHPGQSDVKKTWQDTQKSVTKYMDCARKWYKDHELKPLDTTGACEQEKAGLDSNLTALGSSLEAARQYSWEGWESPEKLHKVLDRK